MDIKGEGLRVSVNPAEQTDEWLLGAAAEIAEAAEARGLELPAFAGTVAVEGATEPEAVTIIEATPYTKESIAEQLTTTHQGYKAVVDSLNVGRKKDILSVDNEETLAFEFEQWFTDDKLAYVVAAQEADPSVRFTLIARPNTLVDHKDIIKAAKAFGTGQPYETYVYDDLYEKYSAEELSGPYPPVGDVVFSLIPSNFTPEMTGTVADQRAKLAKLQTENPDLKVPSVLDAITYWQTLRAQGDTLTTGDVFDRTYIRHFDLPEKRIVDWSYVPGSFVYDNGCPDLYRSFADGDYDARLSVG